MSLPLAHGFDSNLILYVLEPAARSLALAGAVWLLLAAFRVRDVGFRLAAWTAVLYAALAMPFLGRVMPGIPVLLPAVQTAHTASTGQLPAVRQATAIIPAATTKEAVFTYTAPATNRAKTFATSDRIERADLSAPSASESLAFETSGAPNNISITPPAAKPPMLPLAVQISWATLVAGLYGLIAAVLLARLGLGLALSWRIEHAALPIEDEHLERLLERESRKVGLKKAPRVAESSALSIPAAMGMWRPVVLLPRGWQDWSDSQIEAVLAHELSHIARRDPLTQTLSNLHRAIFWFSPLGWWLDRTLVELAEQASDDAALRAGADRTSYAEVLLHFFRALRTARGRVRWQAVSMAQGSRSARRVERILSGSSTSIRLGHAAVMAMAIVLVPLACLAAAVEPSFSAQTQMPAPPPAMAPPAPPAGALAKTPAPAPVVAPAPAPAPQAPLCLNAPRLAAPESPAPMATSAPASAPLILVVPAPFLAPSAPMVASVPMPMLWFSRELSQEASGKQSVRQENENWYSSGDCAGNEAYIVVSGNRTITECGSEEDMVRVNALRKSIPAPFLWFRKDGRSYVIRDAATVNAAIQAFAGQRDLARQQAELGRQQAELGRKQAELGMQQRQIRINVPDFSALMQQMDADLREFNSGEMQRNLQQAQKQMEATLKTLDSSATQEELGRAQQQLAVALRSIDASTTEQVMARIESRMATMQSRLGSLQSEVGERQAALGERQATLGRQQADMGRRQAELGRRQAELARQASRLLRQLIDQALAKGLAKPQ
ncbi:MAG: M48 family metalloprotease [Acidobacteriota bacterium]|nr:M48 family metalloprotease [Acidobacteriota bacterium]